MWWCVPVIPATQEGETRGTSDRGQPGKLSDNLSQINSNKQTKMNNQNNTKQSKTKKQGRGCLVAQILLSICESLGSIINITKIPKSSNILGNLKSKINT